jgi:hypothetical protein
MPHHIDTKSLRSMTRTRPEETKDEISITSAMEIYLQEKNELKLTIHTDDQV